MRKELKEKFIQDFTPREKAFFLKKAREVITRKRYPVCEDLFHYCYFHTLKERIRNISPQSGEGYLRFLLVDGVKDIEEAMELYEKRLEKEKLPSPDPTIYKFIEYFSE